jgi:hypothetical protein
VCGPCSANRIHLDTSRSGGAKRVCNTCHEAILAEEDAEIKARESVRSLSLEAAGLSMATPFPGIFASIIGLTCVVRQVALRLVSQSRMYLRHLNQWLLKVNQKPPESPLRRLKSRKCRYQTSLAPNPLQHWPRSA